MANKGDVELIIRARNEASKTLDSITDALSDLTKTQQEVGASSEKAGALLDQFAKIADSVAAAYNKLQSGADQAAASYARQEAALNESRAAYQALSAQLESAVRVQTRLSEQAAKEGADNKELAAQLKLVEKAYRDLTNQSSRMAAKIEQQESALAKSYNSLLEISGSSQAAADALNKVQAAHQAAARAAEENAAAQAQANAQIERSSHTAARRSALELRRSLTDASSGAQAGWREAERGIRELAQEMARTGQQTNEQIADMARLQGAARANKQAYSELVVAIARYNRVLRDQGASQEDVAAAQARAQAALVGARNLMVQTGSAAQSSAAGVRNFSNAQNHAARESANLERALQSLFANNRRSLSLYQRLRGEVLSLTSSYFGLFAAIQGVNRVLQAASEMQATESRLNVVTDDDPQATADELQWVRNEADRLGFSIQTLASEWSKFAVSAQASNFTMDQTRKIFTSVSEAGRVLRLDSQRMERVFVALTQMMSKGTIQMEELRQQLGEHIPGAFALMAEAAGVSGAELSKMMESGQLTSDYLLKFADVLDQRFGGQLSNSMKSLQAEMGRFQTAVTIALNKIADAGTLDAFTDALRELQEYLRSDDAQIWFDRLGKAIAGAIELLMGFLRGIDLVISALVALGSWRGAAHLVKLGAAISGLIVEMGGLRGATVRARTEVVGLVTQMRTATTTAGRLRAALLAFGGPISIAIGVLAGAFALLATRVSETEKAMEAAKRITDEISSAYRRGAKEAREWTKALDDLTNVEIEDNIKTLTAELNSQLSEIQQPFGRSFMTRARASDSPLRPVYEDIRNLTESARSGKIPLTEFMQRLDAIGEANPQLKSVVLAMIESAKEAAETEKQVRMLEAALALKKGTATEVQKALLGVADATKEVSSAQEAGTSQTDKYKEAMDALAKRIPELKTKLEFETNLKEITQQLQAAVDAAGGDSNLIQEALDRGAKATAALYEEFDPQARARKKAIEDANKAAQRHRETIRSINKELDDQLAKLRLSDLEAKIYNETTAKGIDLQSKEGQAIADKVRKLWDAEQASQSAERQKTAIDAANKALDDRIAKLGMSELQAEIYNETTAKGIDLQSAEGQAIADKVKRLWEAEQAATAGERAEKRVNDLLALRKELQEQITFNQDQGNFEAAAQIQTDLDGINSRLREAIDNAIKFYEALGGDDAKAKAAALQNVKNSLVETAKVTLNAKQINEEFAQGAANAFANAGDAIGAWIEGTKDSKEATEAVRDAFLQFAADFLRYIAQMILQYAIFNAIGGMGGSGGIGGFIAGLVKHTGGLVGNGGTKRAVMPGVFANAVRYHEGGIPGLAPNEVPAILEKGEEVLTRDNPRHALNGGAAGGGGMNLKIVNTFDAGDVVSQAMGTEVGQTAILNDVRSRPGEYKAALGLA